MKIRPVILCGGSGTRLWPLSSDAMPKQLLSLVGSDSLLQATVKRVSGEIFGAPLVVTREAFSAAIAEQLAAVGAEADKILLEPSPRNTAPAIAAAAFAALADADDPLLLVMPSDHMIRDNRAFVDAIEASVPAALAGEIVTFGIPPRWAETGYGYIEVAERRETQQLAKVRCFTEKPDAATAASYVSGGRHLWNAGIFLFRASTILRELREHAPDVADAAEAAVAAASVDTPFVRLDADAFLASPSISIDYAVLEKSNRVSVVEARLDWSDIGSWEALWDVGDRDSDGNVVSGQAVVLGSRDCLIRNDTDAPVALVDSADLIVVVTASGTFVAPRSSAQKAKEVQEALSRRSET
jgi:mannose-1-phosphate guanylyltransferase/mannose-6-phosphate isomerase